MREYDLVVIGAGPGGYEAALEAAGVYGMKTALVEKEALGGTCLNHGCIPTKTLLHSADLFRRMQDCETFGLAAREVSFDMEKVQARKEKVLETLRGGIAARLRQKKVEVIQGCGRILQPHCVEVQLPDGGKKLLDTEHILIAAGSRAFVPPIPGAELENVLTSDALLEKKALYRRLVIIGGGVIGMEFASVYNAFGSEVTVIEALPRIISNMDRELSQSLKMLMKKRGVEIVTGASVEEIQKEEDGSLLCLYKEKEEMKRVSCDGILVCVGRRPASDGLFGPDFSVEMERGRIAADENGCTNVPGVYAIGDVTGGAMLAHAATAMGRNAVAHMHACAAGMLQGEQNGTRIADRVIPGCIYTDPEIASVGMTAEQAKEQGIDAAGKKIVMSANGKTVVADGERGFIKVVYGKQTGKILGAVMMCERASDMISEFTQAIVNGRTMEEMGRIVRPHPTFSEAITEACRV